MRRVIVSGANGFIGSALVHRLTTEGFEVHALVREHHDRVDSLLPANCIHRLTGGPESAAKLVEQIQPDTIFHLATVYAQPTSPQNIARMLDANLWLGASLLYAAAQCQRPPAFVNSGTYWQFNSKFAYAPNTNYAATKHAFYDLLQFHREKMGIPSVTLVLYDTFGEGDTRTKLWQHIISTRPGAPFPLTAGEQIIHLLHIDDVIDAFMLAESLLQQGTLSLPLYTIHSREPRKLRSLVEELNTRAKLSLELKWGAIPYHESQIFEPCIGEPLPGWHPRVDVISFLLTMAHAHRSRTGKPERIQ